MGLFPDSRVVEEIRVRWGGEESHPPEPSTPEEAIPYLFWYLDFMDGGAEALGESMENLKLAITDPDGSMEKLWPWTWRTLFYYHQWIHHPLPGENPERWVYNKDRTKVVYLPGPDVPPNDPAWKKLLQEVAEAEGEHPTLTLHNLLTHAGQSVDVHAYGQKFRDT
jgi:hypothetical protein